MKRALAALLLILACAHAPTRPTLILPDQNTAVDIVWRGVYGRQTSPPDIYWITGKDLDCVGPAAGERGFLSWNQCVAGVAQYERVLVAWWPDLKVSDSALAHELLHAALLRNTDDDPSHLRPELWGAGGLLEKATGALRSAGF